MVATVRTLFYEFPEIFILRVSISLLLLLAFILISLLLYKYNKIDKVQRNSMILLSFYVVVLLYFTVIGRYSQSYYRYEFEIFESYKRLFCEFDIVSFRQILVNLVMLIPVGFLLSLIIKGRFKYFKVIVISFIMTSAIEISQLIFKSGTCEFDDIFNNMISAILGIFLFVCTKSIYTRYLKKESFNG